MLQNSNYKIVDFNEKADIYIINTCTVTNMSDRKSRQMLRRTKELNPKSVLIAVGCYAQVAKQELEKIDEIDLILGNNEKNQIMKFIEKYEISKNRTDEVSDIMHQTNFLDFGTVTYTTKSRAFIKIQDGCNQFCSYCIIPYARGRIRSRQPENILKEIEELAKKGIKEAVLTGIHISSYGKDFKNGYTLINLLEEINKIPNLKRIRISSLEPTIITEEFAKRIFNLDKVCNHFHLSLQSGCDETLKRMNRKYTTQEFEEITKRLRKYDKNVSITTDIIVGFPGETEEEFNTTYKFLEKIGFYKIHVFKYSPRKGTKAAMMENQIDVAEKEKRSNLIIELSNKNEKEQLEKYVGKIVEVLFETEETNCSKGHMKNYMIVNTKRVEPNSIHNVKIEKANGDYLIGEIV